MEVNKVKYGCMLGITKLNVRAYADNIVMYCPTTWGLRELQQKMEKLMNELELQVNTGKNESYRSKRQKRFVKQCSLHLQQCDIRAREGFQIFMLHNWSVANRNCRHAETYKFFQYICRLLFQKVQRC